MSHMHLVFTNKLTNCLLSVHQLSTGVSFLFLNLGTVSYKAVSYVKTCMYSIRKPRSARAQLLLTCNTCLVLQSNPHRHRLESDPALASSGIGEAACRFSEYGDMWIIEFDLTLL